MSNNLLELLKEHLAGDVVSNLASFIGESPKNTESALHTALPSLLVGLVDKSGDSKGLADLFSLLIKGNYDGSVLSNLGALSRGGEETTKFISEGGNLLTSLFGDKVAGITNLIANVSGISKNSSSSLLGFVAPIILSLIGKKLKIGNMDTASGLGSLLSEQSGFLKNLIPAGLRDLLAGTATTSNNAISDFDKAVNTIDSGYTAPKTATVTDTLHNISDTIGDVAEEGLSAAKNVAEDFSETASKFGSHIIDEGKEFTQSATEVFDENAGGGKKILPWILLAAALALVWGLLKSCSAPETKVEAITPTVSTPVVTPPASSPPPAEPVVTAPIPEPAKIEAPAPIVEQVSDFFEKTLSTGYVIKANKDGFESKLVGFIESNEAINKDLWFTMDGVTFDTNKASIKAESSGQITHIAEVLKAFPKVKIKIGGYTDNTGKANANKKLSNNRANAVKKALVKLGTTADRIDAEGYGSEHPVASNDTAEGRQQNRRIDVRVTEK
jgi:OmpA-OmpF porin, OOP family